jgi:hypothetical protein
VAACALVTYLGALWNGFSLDDVPIIEMNTLVHSVDGLWRVFGSTYWERDVGGWHYRPLPVFSYTLDWQIGSVVWFHAVNLAWHAAISAGVAVLARHFAGGVAGLVAGMLFAVHPVHAEAVANVVGRAELMAATGALGVAWAALRWDSVGWSALALGLGLLCKENAAMAPALVAWAWLLGLRRPSRRKIVAFGVAWLIVGGAYVAIRQAVMHGAAPHGIQAAIFVAEAPLTQRLTAVSAFADVARLLLFPLRLRVDYSPAERIAVHAPLDPRFLIGLGVVIVWAVLLIHAWRRGRKIEALGLGWIAIAFFPVSNLAVITGVYVADRTLYLPSVGLVLALGAWAGRMAARDAGGPELPRIALARRLAVAVLVLAAAVRTAIRVPIWHDNVALMRSIVNDSPRSYIVPARLGEHHQLEGRPAQALAAFADAMSIYDRDGRLFISAADAALSIGRAGLADSLLTLADRVCYQCAPLYRLQARAAQARGDSIVAEFLFVRARRLELP